MFLFFFFFFFFLCSAAGTGHVGQIEVKAVLAVAALVLGDEQAHGPRNVVVACQQATQQKHPNQSEENDDAADLKHKRKHGRHHNHHKVQHLPLVGEELARPLGEAEKEKRKKKGKKKKKEKRKKKKERA